MPNKHIILSNCTQSSGYQGEGVTNINAKRLYKLLETTVARGHGSLKRTASDLLDQMERGTWQIRAGVHAGGLGGGGRAADQRQHITLRTQGGTHHLRFHSSGEYLMQIT